MLEKQDLFEARQNGYWTCRVPGIAVTKNGVVLVTTEARPERGGDYDYNDVLMHRWDAPLFTGPIADPSDETTAARTFERLWREDSAGSWKADLPPLWAPDNFKTLS